MGEIVLGMIDLQIKLFTAIGQILIAAAVGGIAWRQWRTAQQQAETARKKLRLDLFERRIDSFNRLKSFLHTTVSERSRKEVDDAFVELFVLCGQHGEIRWLFGPQVLERFRKEVFEKFCAADQANLEVATATCQIERRELLDKHEPAYDGVSDAWATLAEIFAPSLTLLD